MTRVLVRCGMVTAMAAAASFGLGSRSVLAHNDWALPLIGGLAGGYALSSIHHRQQDQERQLQGLEAERPTYYAPQPAYAPPPSPPPAPAAPSAASIESKLNTLDQLAAKGYITKSEYEARRQALLNQL